VHPLPKPGPRCGRRQWKVKSSHILTTSPIKDRTEQEAFASEAIKKKYCKGAKNYRNKKQKNVTQNQFLLPVNLIKKFQ
jgi:1,2-phenylacetyl-CoA epoxidase PaaB subunit